MRDDKVVALAAPQRRAEHPVDLRPRPEARRRSSSAWAGRHAVRHPEHALENGEARGAHAHRLVPLGQQHPARLSGAVVRRRAGACSGRDPKDFLLELIGPPRIVDPPAGKVTTEFWNYGEDDAYPVDTGRLRRVVELAAEKADWGRKLPARHGLGIAAHRSFVTYVATVVEVAVDDKGTVSVPRVDIAIDCGFCVNPERIRSQIEGACVMGMTLAHVQRDHLQERARRAVQLQRLPGVAHRRGAARDARAHRAEHGIDVPPSGVGEPACRLSRRRCATRSSPRPASASARCRSAHNWRHDIGRGAACRPLLSSADLRPF